MEYPFADIIVSVNHTDVDKIFQYVIPKEFMNKIKIGMRVLVPFGVKNRLIKGYVIGIGNKPDIDVCKMKNVSELLDENPIFDKNRLMLAKWMKERYCTTLAACLQCMFPKGIDNKQKKSKVVVLNCTLDINEILNELTIKGYHKQLEIIQYLKENVEVTLTDLRKKYKISTSSITSLQKKGYIRLYDKEQFKAYEIEKPYKLNIEQQIIVETIHEKINKNEYGSFLIHGVTGSGKTEVYMHIIHYVIKQNKQAIVLVPEISLTPQMVQRFVKRFGDKVGFTHSRLNLTERAEQWKKAKRGDISIMLGPRSAIFTPFENLGVIIIDEEHELTYKSESTPKYNTKEVASKLCEFTNSILILGSATPSVDTYYLAKSKEYKLLTMKNRVASSNMPHIDVVDMREEIGNGNRSIFSRALSNAIEERLNKKEQSILFLNRRGHSTFVSCRNCGFVLKCGKCDLPFTYHASKNILMCHHCGNKSNLYDTCPQCGSKYIKYFGIGTQKVEQSIRKMFPDAKILRMDLDTTTKKHSHEKIFNQFAHREADILIGTQMIAKGLDFPYVTLVGVIAADLTLYSSDFRAAERTFQLLTQVSGRAGRGKISGQVIIQTYSPKHYSIQDVKNQDYKDFYNKEIKIRESMEYPPFSNIFTFLITGKDEKIVIESIYQLLDILKYFGKNRDFQIMGPAPAVLSKINNEYRWKIIIKYKDYERLKNYGIYCLNKFYYYNNKKVSVQIDLNPLILN